MRIFIVWSGERSKLLAAAIKRLLRRTIQNARPWFSEEDIAAGADWQGEVRARLQASRFGIVCVTNENHQAPWIHFEAGALSKHLDSTTRIVPLLLDFKATDLSRPLEMFQGKECTKEGTRAMLESINQAMGKRGIRPDELAEQFEMWWPKFEEKVKEIPATQAPPPEPPPLEERLATIVESAIQKLVPRPRSAPYSTFFGDPLDVPPPMTWPTAPNQRMVQVVWKEKASPLAINRFVTELPVAFGCRAVHNEVSSKYVALIFTTDKAIDPDEVYRVAEHCGIRVAVVVIDNEERFRY